MIVWNQFLASASVIAVAGTGLARDGDRIAELTGLGRLWIGVVLVAGATSLPEVLTDVSAALMVLCSFLPPSDCYGRAWLVPGWDMNVSSSLLCLRESSRP